MLAGIINYKLCDRHFECENCEFDNVMRGMLPPDNLAIATTKGGYDVEVPECDDTTSHLINQYLYSLFSDCKIHLDRYYHPSHFWYKSESGNRVQVGIDKLFIKILEPIERIILPGVGETYRKGQLIAWIVRKGKTFPLHSPIKGRIVEINNQILHNNYKQVIENDAYFFKIEDMEMSREVQQMCTDMQGLDSFTGNVNIVRKYLTRTINQERPEDIGATLADGGQFQMGLEKIIGEEAFESLLGQLLCNGTKKKPLG